MSAVQELASPKGRALWIERAEFERAIADDELVLEYEPLLGFRRGYPPKKVETRALWRHPRLGTLSASEFGPQAARAGLAATVTEWVFTTALRQTRAWRRLGEEVAVAVNLTDADLNPRLAGTLAAVLEFSGSVPTAVTCEVPEEVIARRPSVAAQVFSDLRWLGVRVAIDGFGRSLSSFGWLAALGVDEVKLAPDLIAEIEVSADSAARAVTAVAASQALGISVVACGTDGERLLETAKALGCDAAQGLAVSGSLDAAAAFSWLRARPYAG